MSKQKDIKEQGIQASVAQVVSLKDFGITLPEKKIKNSGFSTLVRVLLQNWRQGTVACKGRSDVAYSRKKPWKQKGTGRARAGSARSPLWRGGGVTFGPQARVRTLQAMKKLKKGALATALGEYELRQKLMMLDWQAPVQGPKTAAAYAALKNAGLIDRKITIFVPFEDATTYASFANIPTVRLLFYDQPDIFSLIQSDYWVLFKKDQEHFKGMVERWI
ncbi:50S ribosomal protein L4 [Candidatus Dependentiae bacterium HGW-Dependentiae-1]|nr:MAG: 50S ribosomal protein L4 [Candidatus Dependentiae bacterium HGW-Dependentiae-1]